METKRCGRCGTVKAVDQFHRRGKIRQAWCKACRREYDAAYHRRTRALRIEQKRLYRLEVKEWYRNLKRRPCADCGGVFHPAAMEWDHRPGVVKTSDISSLVERTRSRRRVLAEIAKCDLVCANCHAVRTVNRLRGVAQPGRAPPLGGGSRRFESGHPDLRDSTAGRLRLLTRR
jgi:ribosomal protein S27AE